MFKITHGKGFHVTLANGWTVSVQFGPGNYGDHYRDSFLPEGSEARLGAEGSSSAEVWAWNDEYPSRRYPADPLGYQSPAQFLAFINEVAGFGSLGPALGGSSS